MIYRRKSYTSSSFNVLAYLDRIMVFFHVVPLVVPVQIPRHNDSNSYEQPKDEPKEEIKPRN